MVCCSPGVNFFNTYLYIALITGLRLSKCVEITRSENPFDFNGFFLVPKRPISGFESEGARPDPEISGLAGSMYGGTAARDNSRENQPSWAKKGDIKNRVSVLAEICSEFM